MPVFVRVFSPEQQLAHVGGRSSGVKRMRGWLPLSLVLAGIHSIAWGCGIILLPEPAAQLYGLAETPHDLFLWQGTGLVIVLLGLGYLIAATDPARHWAVVCIGLAAKVLGPIGMLVAIQRDEVSSDVLWLLPVNDIVWWLPFGLIVLRGMGTPPDSR